MIIFEFSVYMLTANKLPFCQMYVEPVTTLLALISPLIELEGVLCCFFLTIHLQSTLCTIVRRFDKRGVYIRVEMSRICLHQNEQYIYIHNICYDRILSSRLKCQNNSTDSPCIIMFFVYFTYCYYFKKIIKI